MYLLHMGRRMKMKFIVACEIGVVRMGARVVCTRI